MALAANQQTQYDQLIKAGASQSAAMNAAMLVPVQQTAPTGPNLSFGAVNPPVSQVTAPATQQTTPAAPAPAPQQTTPASTTQTGTAPTTQTAQQGQQLAMPANGSVVDLLTAAGQDSSFSARQNLATQYGMQDYSGTAAQNQELAKKFIDAYNAKKGTAVPINGAQASSALDQFMQEQNAPQTDPTKAFMDAFAGMNPVEANIFQQLSGLLSSTQTQQSLTDLFKQEQAAQGIPELNMELADVKKIMDGTEDDIRAEITNAGGFATESQVQAMVGARNKTLLKQASYLSNVLAAKNDYVDRIVSLTQADRKQVSDDLDRKLGITKTLFDMSQSMTKAAQSNYQRIVDTIGWDGLAKSLSPNQIPAVEKTLGLQPGELSALASYKKPVTEQERLDLENKRLQNQKLQAELTKLSAGNMTPAQRQQALSMQSQTIQDITSLTKDPGLNSAVGPNYLSRFALTDAFGAKSNFIASVEQLRQQLTLDNLVKAKGSGASFGALSDSELQLLAASATKLGTWAIKDAAGNVTGYNTDEASFKKELDKINYYQTLDYVLKGGDPSSVGAVQTIDHKWWVQNSDGTKSALK